MENTSKALLIAAAILIAIILITLGITVLGSASDSAKQAQGVGDSISSATKDSTSKLESLLSGLGVSSKLNHSGVIPEGGIYVSKDGTTYNAGQEMPTSQTGDIYTYTDYKYTLEDSGWKVNVLDKNKSSYGDILESIDGKNIISMHSTFAYCRELESSPKIPENVTNLSHTFTECEKLTNAPKIPKNVIYMQYAFYGCKSLVIAPDIPNGVKTLDSTFLVCTNLLKAPTIPGSVTDMERTFQSCISLEGEIEINANPSYKFDCFRNTEKEIKITGTCKEGIKKGLAETATKGNVTY